MPKIGGKPIVERRRFHPHHRIAGAAVDHADDHVYWQPGGAVESAEYWQQQNDGDFNNELVLHFDSHRQLTRMMQEERANRLQWMTTDRIKALCRQMFVSDNQSALRFAIYKGNSKLTMNKENDHSGSSDMIIDDVGSIAIRVVNDGTVEYCKFEAPGANGNAPDTFEMLEVLRVEDKYMLMLEGVNPWQWLDEDVQNADLWPETHTDDSALIEKIGMLLEKIKTNEGTQVFQFVLPEHEETTNNFLKNLYVDYATPHLVQQMHALYDNPFDETFYVTGNFTSVLAGVQ